MRGQCKDGNFWLKLGGNEKNLQQISDESKTISQIHCFPHPAKNGYNAVSLSFANSYMAIPPIDDDFSFGCAIHQRLNQRHQKVIATFCGSLVNNHSLFYQALLCSVELVLYVKDNITSFKFPRFQNPILKNIQAVYYQNG